jgi:phosphatidate phosphatase PAH1
MNTFGRLVSKISDLLEFNQATLSGALDVIVIEHPDGSFHCNPFRVRFGKLKVLRIKSQKVCISINGEETPLIMKLKNTGEGFFEVKDFPEEAKSESSSPDKLQDPARAKAEQILPKRGDFCDDILAGDEDLEPEEAEVEMSLCAHLWDGKDQVFQANRVTFEDFARSPWEIIENPNLLVRIGNKLFTKEEAVPMILSLIVFKKEISGVIEKERPRSDCVLTSEQLKALGLKEGKNEVVYTVNSHLQGEQSIRGRIFLWKWNCKIIVSDIDGTITKSDVLGHLYNMFGKDYNHPGIAKFYSQLVSNGYKIVYLSSRAIGQANVTREFLLGLRQDQFELPDGPLIISPDRLFKSFFREVIQKTPQEFKANALLEIQQLFPKSAQPFYAGFGNRDTDAIAYRTAGVELDKIFIINPSGNIFAFDSNTYARSYPELHDLCSDIFPTCF